MKAARTLPSERASSNDTLVVRIAIGAFIVVLLTIIPLSWCMRQALDSMFNAPYLWVPDTLEAREQYDWFVKHFGSDRIVLASWSGCTVDDPRLADFETALRSSSDPQKNRLYEELFERVSTGYSAVRMFTGGSLSLSKQEALKRLSGTLVGKDGKTSCAVLLLTEDGDFRRHEAISAMMDEAQKATGLDPTDIHLAGAAVDGAAVDKESVRSMYRFGLLSTIVTIVVAYLCLRSSVLTIALTAAGIFARTFSLGIIYLAGSQMNAVFAAMPALVFALTVAVGIHLANYFFEDAREHQTVSPWRALKAGWTPCTLAVMTTTIGLVSLSVSEIEPVRLFGVFSAVSYLVGVSLLFLLLPGAMALAHRRTVQDVKATSRRPIIDRLADGFLATLRRWAIWIVALFLAILVPLGWGLAETKSTVNIQSYFVAGSRSVNDHRWFEDSIGPLTPVEILVHFDQDCGQSTLRRLQIVGSIEEEMRRTDHLQTTIAATTFAPRLPRASGGVRQVIRRRVFNNELKKAKKRFANAGYLCEVAGAETWRVSGRVDLPADVDLGNYMRELKRRLGVVVAGKGRSGSSGVHITCTGGVVLLHDVQRTLLQDLFRSFFTAVVLVAITMIIVLRSFLGGLVIMIPNIFPAAVVLGAMGWLQVPIDIGSVMTASIALGISIDDSLHFVCWFRRETSRGATRIQAIHESVRHCARPMILTTLVLGLSMVVFALSTFAPTRQFGRLMFLLLSAALLGDLLLLPALLAAPFGKTLVRMSKTE